MPMQVHSRRVVPTMLALAAATSALAQGETLRPQAVPLVTVDPYFSIWSRATNLTDAPTTHWTGSLQQIRSAVYIDGKPFRLMGTDSNVTPALPQTGVKVLPTRSIYNFAGEGVAITLTFTTPALPEDIDLLSRPVTYLTWDVRSTDGKTHDIALRYDSTGEPAVDVPGQVVKFEKASGGGLSGFRVGTTAQPVLQKVGDSRRIDWGYLYAVGPKGWRTGALPPEGPAGDGKPAFLTNRLGKVGATAKSTYVVVAYDDLYGIQYFTENLRPYWRRNGMDAQGLLKASASEYASLVRRCAAFDDELMADLRRLGGERYAQISALVYRQTWAGSKIAADKNGQPLLFPKENSSNGCIGTVDIIFPMSPQVLLFGPSLTKALLVSNLDYASSSYWKWPFAPHDIGTYPKANGQVYGGGERTEENQMPVEESGNMLILTLALAQMEGNAKFAEKYWPTLTRWAEYLRKEGFDPANQLSTDDFMGHLAHQTNLSIKATLGLGAYAGLAKMLGKPEAAEYERVAKEFATRWEREANDGDHYRLAFDQPGTWSQKYNLVWDKILGLGLYDDAVRRKEMAFYRSHLHRFGLALDSRRNETNTKLDWNMWTATLTGDRADSDAILDGVWKFVNESKQRVPQSDWYNPKTGDVVGFIGRPVVGGAFVNFLYDKALWNKWAMRDTEKSANWAPLPRRPRVEQVVPTAETEPALYSYTTKAPSGDWTKVGYDDSAWANGRGGFGGNGAPSVAINTAWTTTDLWARREFTLTGSTDGLVFRVFHDEDAEIYINGVKVATLDGYSTEYENLPLDATMKAALKPGKNLIAVHVRQTGGGQGFDAGFARLVRD